MAMAGEQAYPYWSMLRPGLIVDLGAGAADFCLEAQARGWAVKGVEQSSFSIQLARLKGFELVEASLQSSQSLDLVAGAENVVLNHVFEHVVNPVALLSCLHQRMQPGARLLLLLPNPRSLWRYIFASRWYGWDPPIHVHHYPAPALKALLQSQGFAVRKLRSIRRNGSLAVALQQVGVPIGGVQHGLALLMTPVMPLLAAIGLAPELLCVAERLDESPR